MATELVMDCATGEITERAFTPPPPRVPNEVSPLQMRRALRRLSIKPAIDAFVASQGEEAQEAWDFAVAIRRDDPLVELARIELGKSHAELDAIFILADSISAASI